MKTALIVDDDEITQQTLNELLERVHFGVDRAEDGNEGIKRIRKNTYDLILLDIKMPGIDGEQVMRILNKDKKSLPVIIVSAYLTKDRIVKLGKLGVKGFLPKPIDIKNFYRTVNTICPLSPEKN